MRRIARRGEFRSNLHRGGEPEGIAVLDERYAHAAVDAAKVMSLEVCGVDMLETRRGPRILEINSSPGLEGIEKATGADVATAIIKHAEKYAKARASGRGAFPGRDGRALDDEKGPPRRRTCCRAIACMRTRTSRSRWTSSASSRSCARSTSSS